MQEHRWVTDGGRCSLLTEEQNCILITVTEEEVENVVKHVPKLDTLVSGAAEATVDASFVHGPLIITPSHDQSSTRTIQPPTVHLHLQNSAGWCMCSPTPCIAMQP